MTPDDAWEEMQRRFRVGSIGDSTRQELLTFLGALTRLQIRSEENRQRAHQMGDTMRQLLAGMDAAESGRRARMLSRLALFVSIGAFLLAAILALR